MALSVFGVILPRLLSVNAGYELPSAYFTQRPCYNETVAAFTGEPRQLRHVVVGVERVVCLFQVLRRRHANQEWREVVQLQDLGPRKPGKSLATARLGPTETW
jgi:hypothetical protein